MAALIRSASLTNYAEVARTAGLDPPRMLSEFGLPHALPATIPSSWSRSTRCAQLLEASAERSGVEAFGLLMAETRQLSNLGPLGLLVREQPTLRLALEAFVALRPAAQRGAVPDDRGSRRRRRAARGADRRARPGPCASRPSSRSASRSGCCSTLLGTDWRPRRVCFAHDAPADRSVHERVFGRNVEFGHDFNGIVCARADLEAPNPNADPAMARLRAADARGRARATRRRDMRDAGARAGRDAARHAARARSIASRSTWASTGARSTAVSRARARPFRRSSTRCGASSRERYLEGPRTLARRGCRRCSASRRRAGSRAGTGGSSAASRRRARARAEALALGPNSFAGAFESRGHRHQEPIDHDLLRCPGPCHPAESVPRRPLRASLSRKPPPTATWPAGAIAASQPRRVDLPARRLALARRSRPARPPRLDEFLQSLSELETRLAGRRTGSVGLAPGRSRCDQPRRLPSGRRTTSAPCST